MEQRDKEIENNETIVKSKEDKVRCNGSIQVSEVRQENKINEFKY